MKLIFIFTFLIALFKGGILIGVGVLLRYHFVTFVSLIRRKELPDNLIWSGDYKRAMAVIRTIGLLITLTGVAIILLGLASLIVALSMPGGEFQL